MSPCLTLKHYSLGPHHDVTHPVCTQEIFEKHGLHYRFLLKLLRTDLGVDLLNYASWASESLYFIFTDFALSWAVSFGYLITNKYYSVDPPS